MTVLSAIILEIVALTIGGSAPHLVALAVAASPVGMTAFAIFVIVARPEERTAAFRLIIAVTVAVFALLWLLGLGTANAGLAAGASIPVTVFGYLAAKAFRHEGHERAAAIDLLAATTIIGVSALSMVFFLDFSTRYFNPIFDERYIRIDALFGAQPSAVVAALFDHVRPLMWLCAAIYFALPVAQAIVAGLEARTPRPGAGLGILPGFVITAMVGYLLYALMPAIGPLEYLGHGFPQWHIGADYLAARSTIDLNPDHLRGAMPSLHITWATLLYFATRGMRPSVRIGAAIFLFLTFLATLGLGMHYLIDLIVALPLILLVRALGAVDLSWQGSERPFAVGVGVALLAGWVVLTRLTIDVEANRLLLFAAMAVTAALPLFLIRRLDRAAIERTAPLLVPVAA